MLAYCHSHIFINSSFLLPQTEDTQKLQLIPLKNPLITSEHLHEKLVQPANDASSATPPANVDENGVSAAADVAPPADNGKAPQPATSKKHATKEAKRLQKLHKQQLKQQNKKNNKKASKKEANNNNSKKRTANEAETAVPSSPTIASEHHRHQRNVNRHIDGDVDSERSSGDANNEHIARPLTNVRFAFDKDGIDSIDEHDNGVGGGVANVNGEHREQMEMLINNITAGDAAPDANGITVDNHNEMTSAVIEIIEPSSHDVPDHRKPTSSVDAPNDISGTYDELPLIQIEHDLKVFNCNDGVHRLPPSLQFLETNLDADIENNNSNTDLLKAICFTRSSDSIPFIDESPRRTTPSANFHEARFITIQPQNIGSQSYIYARKIEKTHSIKVPKRDQFDKSAQILYQSLKESIDHHFERVGSVDSKLCQVCHEFLLVPETVKCLTCGLVCHHSCTASPKVRANILSYLSGGSQ